MNGNLVTWIYCVAIAILGLAVLYRLNTLHRQIRQDHDEAKRVYNKTVGESVVDISSGIYGYSEQIEFDIKDMDPIRGRYNEHSASYIAAADWISLFPLMGLLGTVLGLIPGLASVKAGDFEVLYTSLSTALYTTLTGLVCSIILKAVAASHGKTMNSIENYFDETDRKYSQALGLGRVTDRL